MAIQRAGNAHLPTLYDVARDAGVSPKTVSRALNGEAFVAVDTRSRVLESVERLGYRRNDMARSLRSQRGAEAIGLIVADIANPFFGEVAKAVEEIAMRHGKLLVTSSSDEAIERERSIIDLMLQQRLSGLIVVPAGGSAAHANRDALKGTPAVYIDRRPGYDADCVIIDNYATAKALVTELLEKGHRRIAVLGDLPRIDTARERLEGYDAAHREAGLLPDQSLRLIGPHTPEDARRVAHACLTGAAPPTAFFTINNHMTVGVMRACKELGTDIEIVGFDLIPSADLLEYRSNVRLIPSRPDALGRRAAEMLFRRIREPDRATETIVLESAPARNLGELPQDDEPRTSSQGVDGNR